MVLPPESYPFGKILVEALVKYPRRSSQEFPVRVLGYDVDAGLEAQTREIEREMRAKEIPEPFIGMALTWALETAIGWATEAYRDTPEIVPTAFPLLYKRYLKRAQSWALGMKRAFYGP